jgi:hypothetical protein
MKERKKKNQPLAVMQPQKDRGTERRTQKQKRSRRDGRGRTEQKQSRDGPNKRSFGMKNRAKTDRFWNVGPVKAGSRQQTADSRQQTADSRQQTADSIENKLGFRKFRVIRAG